MTGEFSDVSILLIEDQLFIRSMMARMLNGIGFRQILQARDGQEGIDMVTVGGDQIDIILCDLTMPNLDGFGFLEKLRALPNESARIPVVMLTASSDPDSVRRLLTLGIVGYIVKPTSTQTVVERVRAALRGSRKTAN